MVKNKADKPGNIAVDESALQDARSQLIETASEIMRHGDTVDISLSELSLRSGLNSALVKYYFGNKQGLLLSLLDRDMRNIIRSLDALIAKNFSPEEKLRLHIAAVIKTYYRYPYLNRLLMRMVRDSSSEDARKIADEYLRPISDAYHSLVNDGVASGAFRKLDPQLFYLTITGAADRFFTSRQVMEHCFNQSEITEEMRDDYIEHTLAILLNGILQQN